jgi:hypothetical protein
VEGRRKGSRALVFAFSLAFLFETWVWDRVVAMARRIAALIPWEAFKAAVKRLLDRLPPAVALLAFGVPFLVAELGSLISVVLVALGHVVAGAVGYAVMKFLGLGLVAAIFDLTRDKLLTMPWFAFLYRKALSFHTFARRLVAPYRQAAKALLHRLRTRLRVWARAYRRRRVAAAEEEAG